MLILGLTGSIATGKSTVASILTAAPYNLPIIDADKLARQVVEPGTPGYDKIVKYFASSTPDLLQPASDATGGENGPNGKGRPLNRPALGKRVFGDAPDKRRDRMALNKIVHPAVRWEIWKGLFYNFLHGYWATVLDVPLLYEAGMDRLCGTVMVVAVSDADVQIRRLRERDPHLSEDDARDRVQSQGSIKEKVKRTEERGEGNGVVVWNDGDRRDLKNEVDKVMRGVREQSPEWWAWMLLLLPPLAAFIAFENLLRSAMARKKWMVEKQQERARL